MRIVVTGAAGFVGRGLVTRLLQLDRLGDRTISAIVAMDLSLDGLGEDSRLIRLPGDFGSPSGLDRAFAEAVDVVFHLASVPGGTAERDYPLARKVNLDATLALLERCRQQVLDGKPAARFVFASSIAVFGELADPVNDDTPPRPVMTYGVQKLMGELLVADFTRKRWLDGISLRLPGVLARPSARTGQMSAFMSDIIREVAAGRPFVCPTSRGATIWASSLPCVIDNLLHASVVASNELPAARCVTMPTTHVST